MTEKNNQEDGKGRVCLVGAGPGDAGLITVKGLEALKRADVIVYDHLAAESLLNESRPETEWIDAGKYAGNHHMKQDEIEALLVERARRGQMVVRLKGGDPFIFGRGGEEAMALAAAGIPFEVIPGISSAYGAAAGAGIPVTHRGVASSFHVVTGHEDPLKGKSSLDYGTLAKEEGTLVFLMGLSRAKAICDSLMAHGKAADTPAAAIASGSTARQRCICAPLGKLAARIEQEKLQPPAILLVGAVAALHSQIACPTQGPLAGRRILVTASGATAKKLGRMISDLGGEAVILSLIDVKLLAGLQLGPILKGAPPRSWIVFTSRNGVQLFFEQMKEEKLDARILGGFRFAVMGNGTGNALEAHHYYADLTPEISCSQGLAEALCRAVGRQTDGDAAGCGESDCAVESGYQTDGAAAERGESAYAAANGSQIAGNAPRVLMFRASEASAVLGERLSEAGIAFEDIPLYETVRQYKKARVLNQVLADVDGVTFCSASAAEAFAEMTDGGAPADTKVFCIGPVTAKAARGRGISVDSVAERYDLEGLVERLCEKMR